MEGAGGPGGPASNQVCTGGDNELSLTRQVGRAGRELSEDSEVKEEINIKELDTETERHEVKHTKDNNDRKEGGEEITGIGEKKASNGELEDKSDSNVKVLTQESKQKEAKAVGSKIEGKSGDTERQDDQVDGYEQAKEAPSRPSEHIVRDRETVNSIAALYDVTPSELAQTNRLGMARLVFPGQVLRVPAPPPPPLPPPPAREEREQLDIVEYQFIKLKVRHITLGRGVVSGSILFTPNAVIFDPDPKDPLVEELEPEAFQIIAPMEFVVNAAIFLDFFPIGSTSKCEGREHPPSELYRGLQGGKAPGLRRSESVGSGYSLCQETEERAKGEEEAPPPPRSEPYYLRLTMGRPVQREVARSTPTMAYGMQTMMPEYWFIVPSLQVLNLYNFFQCWFPEIYSHFDLEEVHEMGFELVQEPELHRKEVESDVSLNTASRKMIHKTMTLMSIDQEMLLPELDLPSQLVSDDQRKLLHRHLPPRLQGYDWRRLFCTDQDGFSLASLYRRVAATESAVLLIVQDTEHAVFGAMLSCAPKQSEAFLGTGESWLFTFFPSFKVK